jgi:hypothetical protein
MRYRFAKGCPANVEKPHAADHKHRRDQHDHKARDQPNSPRRIIANGMIAEISPPGPFAGPPDHVALGLITSVKPIRFCQGL